ncbi:MAG: hypothetical protein WCH99_18985 [Verrucomicrobiota bacterium]
MRDFADFSAREWIRFEPLQIAFKQLRNDALLSVYRRLRTPRFNSFIKEVTPLKDRNIALVIAFEQPWALNWLLQMASLHLTDTTVLVFDNSRRAAARQEIEQVCRNHATPYLALPTNPTRHVNRSHGMAMTWVFYNVVRAIAPQRFAFIDHDMIPIQKVSFSESLGNQPFYGFRRSKKGQFWNLWAGYCLFDFSYVAEVPLNFLYDFSLELDTGGRNWKPLYQKHDQSRMHFANNRFFTIRDPVSGSEHRVQVIDDQWLHIGGIGYNGNFAAKSEFYKNLAQALDQGISWSQVCRNKRAG